MSDIKIIQGDCLEIMKTFSDKQFDLVLTDPPFGLGNFVQNTGNYRGEAVTWNDSIPPQEVFNEIRRVSKNRIIWGANFFNCFEKDGGAIVWNKFQPLPNFSKAEIASCTFHKKTEMIDLPWAGWNTNKVTNHPCERPVDLYVWCLNKYTNQGDYVLDCYSGSGSVSVACERMGRNCIGIEISPEYCAIARKRVQEEKDKMGLFN